MSSASSPSQFTLRDVYLQGVCFELLLYGVYATIVSITLWAMHTRKDQERASKRFTVVMLVMFFIATVHAATSWAVIREAFSFHGDDSNSVYNYLNQPTPWIGLLGATAFALNTLIADCVLIWRCWIIWGRDWRIPILPILCTIVGTVFSAFSLVQQSGELVEQNIIFWGTPYFMLSLVTTLLSTFLIIYRILRWTRVSREMFGEHQYTGTIEIVVESSALYTIALVIFVVTLVRNLAVGTITISILAQITGISPALILARVSLGVARPSSLWSPPSSILFATSTPVIQDVDVFGRSEDQFGRTEFKAAKSETSASATVLSDSP